MDIFYHTVLSVDISQKTLGYVNPIVVFLGVLPDVVGSTPFYYEAVKHGWKMGKTYKGKIKSIVKLARQEKIFGYRDRFWYLATHSISGVLMSIPLCMLLMGDLWYIGSLSYLAHVLVDMPVHDGEFAILFLYPLSSIKLLEGKYWKQLSIRFFALWATLIVVTTIFALGN